jgi:hypothetical protein
VLVELAAVVLLAGAVVLLRVVVQLRRRVRRAAWVLARASAAVAEARRASVTVSGLQLVDHLLGSVARNGEPETDAAG